MRIRNMVLAVLVMLSGVTGTLILGGAGAQAAVIHEYLSQITEIPAKGAPPAEAVVAEPGPFADIDAGLAVDEGELLVAEGIAPQGRVDKFDAATGAFTSQFLVPSGEDIERGSFAVGHGTGETQLYLVGDESSGGPQHGVVHVVGGTGQQLGTWTGSDTPAGQFGCFECAGSGGAAVDGSGNPLTNGRVYVLDPEHDVVDVFEAKVGGGEKYLTQLTGPEPAVPFTALGHGRPSIAVDQLNGDLLVLDGATAVDVFEPTLLGYTLVKKLTGTPSGPFERLQSVAVDGGNGDIYVGGESQPIAQFNASGAYLGHLPLQVGRLQRLGSTMTVDPATHELYVEGSKPNGPVVEVFGPSVVVPDVAGTPASSVKPASATLNGTVNPDGVGAATCRFEWGTSPSFGKVAPCEPEGVADGSSPVAVYAALTGLRADTTYYYRLVAANANGTNVGEVVQDQEFHTPGPGVDQQAASVVTATSATLNAAIDPDDTPTTYYFEYGTGTAYGATVPAAPGSSLGAGKGDVAVSIHLQGLTAGTTYHYRVVAVAEVEGEPVTVDGPDQIFTTQANGTAIGLPDGRAWELVSPPNKQGAAIIALGNEQGDDIQAAADGDGITYGATSSFIANPAGNRSIEVTQVISSRQAPGVWSTADISTPHNDGAKALAVGHSAEYKLFSDDLAFGLVEPADDTPLPPLPAGAERTLYLREADGAYKALVTAENVAPGVKFGNDGEGGSLVNFVSGTPDMRHIILTSLPKLTAGAGGGNMLYEWSAGQLQVVSVLPDHEPTAASLGNSNAIVRHAISDDGSRLVFQTNESQSHLYLRDVAKGETVAVDAAQGAPEPRASNPSYTAANSDDSRVFFTDTEPLTSDSTASQGAGGPDLYVFEVTSGAGEPLAGKLTDLTIDGNTEESAGVHGVIGASEDGSYLYFVAGGVLGDGAAHDASPEGNNLYVVHYEAGTKRWAAPQFIASLAAGDSTSWTSGFPKEETSRVSPNGRYLAFMSEMSLTGYENHDANSDIPDQEVFLYDASTGRLVCASCNPTGARPVGSRGSRRYQERLWDYAEIWGNHWVAGDIPGWTTTNLGRALSQSRYLSDSGRLFFNSSDALVPADVNGEEDVYEYEPAGVGSCQGPTHGQSASVVFSETLGGCVGLISAGTSSEESAFMGASESGADVFFLTLSRLAPQDYDTSIDLYDAHECTAAEPCAPAPPLASPPCTTGDACKPGPTPQPTLFGAPSSETFSGAGNIVPSVAGVVTPRASAQTRKLATALKVCRKKSRKRRAACERRAHSKYGAKQSRVAKSLSTGARR